MNARRWTARRVGKEIHVSCMRDFQKLLGFALTEQELLMLLTQLEVARRVPPALSSPSSTGISPPSHL